ncbi:hypothetical protein [Paenibacillus cymbidii]|uniref:hypothetical protein n=1 Tax=Paenibacillus cymbidii TaxID=1639034 RepID=UPI0010807012|nr:hypothetical protein [Paenibacillus cymbidii]
MENQRHISFPTEAGNIWGAPFSRSFLFGYSIKETLLAVGDEGMLLIFKLLPRGNVGFNLFQAAHAELRYRLVLLRLEM